MMYFSFIIWLHPLLVGHVGSLTFMWDLLAVVCGIQFPDQGSNEPPALGHRVVATGPPVKSRVLSFKSLVA